MGGSRPSTFQLMSSGKLRLLSTMELLTLPPPTWLVEPILPTGGLVGLYGAPGTGKTFVALDLALSVAVGLPWQGHATQKGFVVYISAEGGTGIGKRVAAWLLDRGAKPEDADIAWLIESIPVHTDSEQMTILIQRIVNELDHHPVLVVIDTLARCFDGDENQQEDMGRFIAGVDQLKREFGCTVLIVHHTRLGGDRERGNTVFRGAADTMIFLESQEEQITLVCDKQKDAEEFSTLELERRKVDGTDSCVVRGSSAQARLQDQLSAMVGVLRRLQPCKWDSWVDASGLSTSQFQKYFPLLKKQGLIERLKSGLWTTTQETGGGGGAYKPPPPPQG